MDKILEARNNAIIAHRKTKGMLSMVDYGMTGKAYRLAFMRAWSEYEKRFPFVKRIV